MCEITQVQGQIEVRELLEQPVRTYIMPNSNFCPDSRDS